MPGVDFGSSDFQNTIIGEAVKDAVDQMTSGVIASNAKLQVRVIKVEGLVAAVDGGQIVYQLIEWAKGSPMSERAQAFGQQVGIALLILLMSVALFNDIARQFS